MSLVHDDVDPRKFGCVRRGTNKGKECFTHESVLAMKGLDTGSRAVGVVIPAITGSTKYDPNLRKNRRSLVSIVMISLRAAFENPAKYDPGLRPPRATRNDAALYGRADSTL